MTLKFKPDDFRVRYPGTAARYAQSIFDKWLSEQKVVYGPGEGEDIWGPGFIWKKNRNYQARLVDIQPIKE